MAKRKINPVLGSDEDGKPVVFTLPYDALFYATIHASCEGEMRVEVKGIDTLVAEAEIRWKEPELLLFDDDDKMDLVKLYKRKRQWLK